MTANVDRVRSFVQRSTFPPRRFAPLPSMPPLMFAGT
jgi:hypothetical protein